MPMVFIGGAADVPISFSITTDSGDVSNVNTHPVTLPSVTSANRLVIFGCASSSTSHTWPAGWNEIIDSNVAAGAWRDCDGSEGASINVTSSGSSRMGWVIYKFTGAASGIAPEVSTVASSAGSTTPDPNSLSPSWGNANAVWIAFAVMNSGTSVFNGFPSGYTNTGTVDPSGSGQLAYASKTLQASSENPGAFSLDASQPWEAYTIAVKD